MHTTLDHLEKHIKENKSIGRPKNFLKEIKMLSLIFVITFVGMLLFTNAQLFFWSKDNSEIVERSNNNIQENNEISAIIESNEKKEKEVEDLILNYQKELNIEEKSTALSSQEELKSKLKSYDFDFNVLPPTDRLIVSKINLDVPLIDSKYKNRDDFTQWNFDEELENGVVKYPTTPQPWFDWNTLLFGHTSQEWREKNSYWTVFSRLPELELWDEIKVIWKWKLYEYKVLEKIIVVPNNVNNQYQKYQKIWEDHITLMWCYPLGRTDKRMMVTAKRVK